MLCLGSALALIPAPALAQINLGDARPELAPPPPPPSPYMSEIDYHTLDAAFEAVRDDDWRLALDLANQMEDPVGRDLVRWLWVQDRDGEAPFAAIIQFLNEHPDWPRTETLLRRAEEAIPEDMPPDQIVAWFAGNEPVTGDGKVRLGEAYLELGNRNFAAHWIREAWVHHDFTGSEERRIAQIHGDLIDEASHIARAERLLWDHEYNAARRMRDRVPSDFRSLMDAWLSLMALDSHASSRVAGVDAAYQDHPGLLYERIRWRRRKNRDEEAWEMLVAAPTTAEELGNPERWWTERHIQARNALREHEYQTAYDMVAGHGMTSGGDFADAEWLAGWIALRFLNQPELALQHFTTLAEGVSYPISLGRAYYWIGRTQEVLGNEDAANEAYRTAMEHPTTYYGQLAMEELGGRNAYLRLPDPPHVDDQYRAQLRAEPLLHAAELLSEVATERLQFSWFLHLGNTYTDPVDLQVISDMAREFGQWHMAVRVGKIAMYDHNYLTETTYPLVDYEDFEADIPLPEMALVLGLSRQESEFNPEARSSAGARGLMQLMPSTARTTARRIGVAYQSEWLTEQPSYNTQLGRYHLGEMLERYEGSYIMAIAAYNAGPHRVDRWIQDYGDPREADVDAIDWVELLPFRETRNYVQRVLENTMVYRNRLTGEDLAVTLSEDLARGHGQPPVMLASAVPAPEDDPVELALEATPAFRPNPEEDAPDPGTQVVNVPTIDARPEPAPHRRTGQPRFDPRDLPTEGNRVVIAVEPDEGLDEAPIHIPEETLIQPESQVWVIPEGCADFVLNEDGELEGTCTE